MEIFVSASSISAYISTCYYVLSCIKLSNKQIIFAQMYFQYCLPANGSMWADIRVDGHISQ